MRLSKLFGKTLREVPAEAETASHQLLLKAGMIQQVAAGVYSYLPVAWRVLRKMEQIIREEMDAAGGQELNMPVLQPLEIWEESGRDLAFGKGLFTLQDRRERKLVLAPTHEEVITDLARRNVRSYRDLPLMLYQIQTKFRDEIRPRFGVMRGREFIMKDAYSFDADEVMLEESYRKMYDAYCKIFQRCGVEYVIVQAESGEMGGSGSHQFTVPCENGEDVIVHTEDNSRAWNIEKAPVDPLAKQPTPDDVGDIEEVHTPKVGTIEAVCDFLKTKPRKMVKTILYGSDDKVIAVLVRGDHDVNEEKLTQACGGKHIELADEATVVKVTNAAVGFAGPVGLAENVDTILVDNAVAAMGVLIAGANKTDYHVKNVVPGRDFPLEGDKVTVTDLRSAVEGDTIDGDKLLFKRGIEVGQVFKLGTKYSKKLGAKFLDAEGTEKPCLMGCYGIGINRILASAIELGNDKNGMILPISIAPWEVIITLAGNSDEIIDAGEKVYTQLKDLGVDVLLDDRDMRPGVKFKDADILGIPVRVTIGKRSIAEGNVEVKLRAESESENVKVNAAAQKVGEIVSTLKNKLKCGT
ncbi:MAG: proline--tRNA ligase [Planctomycetes bacterium]|nr:proline--tRNA ligase [Planctomycetota bacterium]